MATYRQTKTVYESDYGDVTVDIILADTYDNIFTDEYYTIDIIDFKDVDKKLENAIGQLSTDEATFEIDESTFKMNNDTTIVADSKTQLDIDNEALELCTTSTSTAFNYIAIFVNTDATPSFDDALFIGAIDFDYDEEYLTWTGDDYTTTRSPLKKYKFKTTPVQESLFDAISLQTVIDAAKTEILTYNHNAQPNGYNDGNWDSVTLNTIQFDRLLKILTDEYVTQLDSAGYGTFTITYADCTLDGTMHPIRYKKPLADNIYGHIIYFDLAARQYTLENSPDDAYDVYGDEGVTVKLIKTSGVASVHERLIIPTSVVLTAADLPNVGSIRTEVLTETAEKSRWQENTRVADSFTNLLYALATDFGLALEFVFTSQTEIEIRFIPKSETTQSQLYIKNAEKASSKKFQLEQREEEELPKGVVSHLAKEHKVLEVIGNTASPTHVTTPAKEYAEGKNTPKSLVAIGNAVWKFNNQSHKSNLSPDLTSNGFMPKSTLGDPYLEIHGLTIPYNTVLRYIPTGAYSNTVAWNSTSFSQALYLDVAKRSGETYAPATYVTPIGMYRVKQDGTDTDYLTLDEYRRSVNNFDLRTYGRELNLTVPYLMAFSNASNGAGADIKNLTIGRKIVLDTVEYVVTGFKINIQDWKVDIKLENTGRFNFETSSLTSDYAGKGNSVQSTSNSDDEAIEERTYTASGAITAGQLVSLKTATTVEKAVCVNTHYNRVIGVALNDATDTEGVNVQVSGKVEISTLSGSVNDAVFLRDVSGTVNTSTTQLTAVTGSEDYYLEVGRIVDTNIMQINIKEGFVIL